MDFAWLSAFGPPADPFRVPPQVPFLMDLLSTADRITAHDHEDPPLTPAAVAVMWTTVLMPYLALAALIVWVATLSYSWLYLTLFVVCYLLTGFGVTIGYHRLLAHKAFSAYRPIEGLFLILGSMAMQGPPIRWAATHRRHHQSADDDGDPHSPHLHGTGMMAVLKGLWHAHTGWLLTPNPSNSFRSVKDLLRNPLVRWVDRHYVLWQIIAISIPFAVGWVAVGSLTGALACVFWGVILRIGLLHHVTWSVNSICHFFGYRSYQSGDESRNNPIIAVLSLGEGWHNNHHAFPTSAKHGLAWFEVDPSYLLIRGMERLGLARNVRRPGREALRQKRFERNESAAVAEATLQP